MVVYKNYKMFNKNIGANVGANSFFIFIFSNVVHVLKEQVVKKMTGQQRKVHSFRPKPHGRVQNAREIGCKEPNCWVSKMNPDPLFFLKTCIYQKEWCTQ